ncbi:MAG: hypothetical protein JWM80_4895 [Cyanobacteria bacterium RYN_339]|nr:hypothetical protein [Cyanobacteria bacterium RYN_339]
MGTQLATSTGARRGSLVVTSFMIILAFMLVFASVAAMLKDQMQRTLDLKPVALAKIQAYYLAEMGLNEALYWANQNPGSPAWPTNGATADFTSDVALVRGTAGSATCTYVLLSTTPRTYQVKSSLKLATDPMVYQRVISFSATLSGSLYQLSSFAIVK